MSTTINIIRRWRSALLLSLLIVVTLPASAENPDVLRVGLMDFPPYYSPSKEQGAEGELVDLLNEVMTELGETWAPQFYEVPQLLHNIVHGDSDIAMLINHPMLEKNALYGRHPIGRLIMQAYHLPQQTSVSSLAELKGKSVILLRGYGYGGLANKLLQPDSAILPIFASSRMQAFHWLQQGKGDYILDYVGPANAALAALDQHDIHGDTVLDKNVYFIISGKLTNAKELLSRMEAALVKVQARK
ncbi:MAG: hypothetical protein V7739_02880 [Motiliproteus sp.]